MLIVQGLQTQGYCEKCSAWVRMRDYTSALPQHFDGTSLCLNSGYSASELKYVVSTPRQANDLATLIRDDDGKCLFSKSERRHSLSCGDGSLCAKERMRLSKALAEYCLAHPVPRRHAKAMRVRK